MAEVVDIFTPLHKSTQRDYLSRMMDDKVHCMRIAKEYGQDYWDGERKFGYGGYRYMEGYWEPVAKALANRYGLTEESKVLDVGCGKGFLLYEIKKMIPGIEVVGMDLSTYGIEHAKEEIRTSIVEQRAQDSYQWGDDYFDLVISLGCFHNLRLFELAAAIREVERVGKNKYVMAESYRDESELFNVQCWSLTCESFFDKEEWVWLYKHFGYSGDYEFIYFS